MTSTLTVRELFVASDGGTGAGLRLPPVPHGLAQVVTGFEWNGLGERVFDLLDLNVIDILLAGWKKHLDVRDQLAATAADPSRSVLVYLGRHTLDSTHAPSIELRAQGRTMLELSFPIELAFEIEAVELTLRAGAVREVRPGRVTVHGTVKLEGTPILERKLSAIDLPGRIVLDVDAPSAPAELTALTSQL
jgi:hypothetical protein